MNLPKRRKHVPMGLKDSTVIRCQSHLAWVRGHECAIAGKSHRDASEGCIVITHPHHCEGRMEAHHVREGANGGVGLKPDDSTAVPLCSRAHADGHRIGWRTFERMWGVGLDKLAADLWRVSPHGIRYRREATAPIAGRQGHEMESGDEASIKDRP